MFKRTFFVLVGLGAGVTLGVWAVRKLEATTAKLTPDHLGGVAASRASALRERLVVALEEGRHAAGAREAELRLHYRGGDQQEIPVTEGSRTEGPSNPHAL